MSEVTVSQPDQGTVTNDREFIPETDFDEAFYLARNADVARGVAAGQHFRSGWHHYKVAGFMERRPARSKAFDSGWYKRTYPQVEREIADGLALDAADHFNRLGKTRGYISGPADVRLTAPVSHSSQFGGLWLDLPNASDIIAGRLAVGLINDEQAAQLRFWIEHGYVVLEGALRPSLLADAKRALEDAYSGNIPGLRFECGGVTGDRGYYPWRADFNDVPAKALDPHFHSAAIRNAIFCKPITDFLKLAFESPALASQTLGFWRGSAQAGHQDTAYVAYTLPRNFLASWTALEDVTVGAGELFYFDGSHKLSDFLFAGQYKTVHDAQRMNNGKLPQGEGNQFLQSLQERAAQAKMPKKVFAAKAGDVLLWHADLVHGGNPVSRNITRKSIVAHYCPNRLAPLYMEQRSYRMFKHGDQFVSSGVYINAEPA